MDVKRGVRWIGVVSYGVSFAILGAAVSIAATQYGLPTAELWSQTTAAWAAALGSFIAALVALKLGQDAVSRQESDQVKRREAAAFIFVRVIRPVMSWIMIFEEAEQQWATRGISDPELDQIIAHLDEMSELIPIQLAPLVLELDGATAKLLADADSMLRTVLARMPRAHGSPLARLEGVSQLTQRLRPFVASAGTAIHKQCYGPDASPLWH